MRVVSLLLTILHILVKCSLKFSLLSIVIPRSLTELLQVIMSFPILTDGAFSFVIYN